MERGGGLGLTWAARVKWIERNIRLSFFFLEKKLSKELDKGKSGMYTHL